MCWYYHTCCNSAHYTITMKQHIVILGKEYKVNSRNPQVVKFEKGNCIFDICICIFKDGSLLQPDLIFKIVLRLSQINLTDRFIMKYLKINSIIANPSLIHGHKMPHKIRWTLLTHFQTLGCCSHMNNQLLFCSEQTRYPSCGEFFIFIMQNEMNSLS